MNLLVILLLLALAIWVFERFYLRGGPGTIPAKPTDPDIYRVNESSEDSAPQRETVIRTVRDLTGQIKIAIDNHELRRARTIFNRIGEGREFASDIRPVDAGGINAEWVLAPGTDPSRRVLYIHGGGFIMGCPQSHRVITSRLSEVGGCAVLSIDYRLMPEHRHSDCVEDCRTAYRWIIENGPDGPGKARQLFFSGDSAGGNLALSLAAWTRDKELRCPDAIVVMSPLTDVTFSGASLRENYATDIMLRRIMGTLNKLPKFVKSWWVVWTYRVRPADPEVSPLMGDLANLPPTLVQASEAEMLLDDARRYVFKAHASGSPIRLQTWTKMVHIWQIFYPDLPQAKEAFDEIGKFIREHE
ncbi:MAG: alpha/beta hydrolase [Xanthomonadales bacterium]|nr:alpha/beta hydrolase [Xanthomonadales bacterium]